MAILEKEPVVLEALSDSQQTHSDAESIVDWTEQEEKKLVRK